MIKSSKDVYSIEKILDDVESEIEQLTKQYMEKVDGILKEGLGTYIYSPMFDKTFDKLDKEQIEKQIREWLNE